MDIIATHSKSTTPNEGYIMNPGKFIFWIFLATVVMIFTAFTSAYIVRRAEGNWDYFTLPDIFIASTVVVILSSITMQWAYFSAKKNELESLKAGLILTLILGTGFLVFQYLGWQDLVKRNIHLVGNVSGSFNYIITAVHAVHVISAVIFLIVTLVSAFQYKIHSKELLRINLCTTYWHFLGLLWVYLYVFLTLLR
jgi:cytochrome c oxidase subunit III